MVIQDRYKLFQETVMPCRHLFNATTHEDRSTGILPNVPNDDDDDDDYYIVWHNIVFE